MCLFMFLPHKFRTRLICMAFIVAFIPVTISALFMYVFLSRLPVEANRLVQRVQEEQLRRIEAEPESAEGFIRSVEFAREVSVISSAYMVEAVDRLGTSFRNMVLLFSGLGMALSLALAFLMGRYFSRAFDEIRNVTLRVKKGDLGLHAKEVMSGEVGELISDLNRMIDCLDKTAVEKRELEDREDRYRDIIENMEEGYYEVDIQGNFTFVNDSICQIYGLEREKVIGTNNRDYMDDETAGRIYEVFNDVYKTGEPCRLIDWVFTLNDGSRRYIEMSAALIRDSDGKPVGFRGISRDISERRVMEERLKDEKDKFESLAKFAPYGISIINPDGKYEYINDKFIKIFGYDLEDVPTGKDWFRFAFPDPEDKKKAISAWVEDFKDAGPGEQNPREFKITCKDGSVKDILIMSVMLENRNMFETYKDVTDRRKLEAQLIQAQKMEAVGTLAGGIAHDFNNLLTAILGNISLVNMDIDSRQISHERLRSIEQFIQSGAELTRQLLSFARKTGYEAKIIDLNELVKASSAMFGRTAKELSMHSEFQKGIWAVEVDEIQIEQVLMNLFVNAWQAMPDGGHLYIQTENTVLDSNYVASFSGDPGRYVKVSVTDTGIGMDNKTLQKIFDPFFTTKEMGKGTGLGLTTAYGIIRNHGGTINVYSEKGKGTTFNIYLPAAGGGAVPAELNSENRGEKKIAGGNETIMLVDDESMILDVGKAMLESLGYNVIPVGSGVEMLKIMSQSDDRRPLPDLIILDMIMPDMGGGEAFGRAREINPDIKILLSSGYSLNGQATRILERGCNGFIQKPFNLTQLAEKIRQILEEKK